jgi:hypothetical protein
LRADKLNYLIDDFMEIKARKKFHPRFTVHAFVFLVRVICPVHHIHLDLITVVIFGEGYEI